MKNQDPSPEQIRLACLEIQAGWTADEKLKRLRVDLRPSFTLADGRRQDIGAEVYNGHHSEREKLQEQAR